MLHGCDLNVQLSSCHDEQIDLVKVKNKNQPQHVQQKCTGLDKNVQGLTKMYRAWS
jgi:hypothetical protein